MFERPFWINRIEEAWRQVPIAWLCGVRRCGKTTLAESLGADRVLYVNCDLPKFEEMVRDPQAFYQSCTKPVVVFDEIHQLSDPSRLLKIGADVFPKLKILATGSSTLAASKKFRDTLTGRKRVVHLVPVTWGELPVFGNVPLTKRLFHGGLPPALLADTKPPAFYREWMDSFFARDIHRLFEFRDMNRFNAVFEYLLRQSGGQFEVTKTAAAVGITRPTVESHLRALETTHAVTIVRPFHGSGQNEIVKQPKIYGFDTGFVSHARGWDPLRQEDLARSGNTSFWNTCKPISRTPPSATGGTRRAAKWTSCSPAGATKWTPSSASGTHAPSTAPPCGSSGAIIPKATTTSSARQTCLPISSKRAVSKSKSATQPASQPDKTTMRPTLSTLHSTFFILHFL